MLVTFKSGLQITASRVEIDAIVINGESCHVWVYFNGMQDVGSIPNPDEDRIYLRPHICNDGKDPHVITMYVIIPHDEIKSITDGGA